ncbi:hypothetical protein GCM10027278_33600 [Paralcaligenes ginsengisoli]
MPLGGNHNIRIIGIPVTVAIAAIWHSDASCQEGYNGYKQCEERWFHIMVGFEVAG